MAIELLYADAHLAGNFANPGNAIGNTPSTWAGVLNSNSSYTSRWSIANPVNPATSGATQTVRVTARKGTNSGTPTIQVNLYSSGSLVSSGTTVNVTSTTGQVVTRTFTSSQIALNNLEVEVVQTGTGGSPSARNTAQISIIEFSADTTSPVPATPTGLSLTVVSGTQINASWNSSLNSTNYELRRSPAGLNTWTTVYAGAATSFSDTGVALNNAYDYSVRGTNATGQSAWSSIVSANTYAPTVPTGLAVTAVTHNSVTISWSASSYAQNYDLQRSIDGAAFTTIASATTALTYKDSGVTPETPYAYRVRANNNLANSDYSTTLEHTTGQVATPVSTVSNTNWVNEVGTTTNLHASVANPSSGTFIESTAVGATVVLGLEGLSDPETHTDHVISFTLEA